jgi:hypothetical protein
MKNTKHSRGTTLALDDVAWTAVALIVLAARSAAALCRSGRMIAGGLLRRPRSMRRKGMSAHVPPRTAVQASPELPH